MTVVGVHIRKITAEKNVKTGAQKVGINNNISVRNVSEHDFMLGSAKQKGLRFSFVFNCKYTPDVGGIDLEGDVLFISDEKKAKEITKKWSETKKLPNDIMEPILNSALNKCNIQAVKLSQDISLPSPIPLPRIERRKEQKAKVTAK
jgi:hypothetical protein